jgi:hypothetical protein
LAKRTLVIASVLVPVLLLLTSVPVLAQPTSFPQFGDSIHDYGVDFDNDGHFDELRIDFTVRITENGTYGFEAYLGNADHPDLLRDTLKTTLAAGEHTLTVKFLGPYLNKADLYGPYVLRLLGTTYVGGVNWGPGSQKSYATAAWEPKSFDPPGAVFADPVTDEGRDTNGDGLIDQIVVRVSIEAVKDVVVTGQASMRGYGLDGWAFVDSPYGDYRHFSKGTWTWEFALDALPLHAVRANGPYQVYLSLEIEGLGRIDYRSHTTAAYSYPALRGPSADFRIPGPSVQLLDPDGNGLADLFVVRVPLRVTEAGNFSAQSFFWVSYAADGLLQSQRATHLELGDQVIDVPFSGITLGRVRSTLANWGVYVTVKRIDAGASDGNQTFFATPAVDPARFESRPFASLSGSILPGGTPYSPQCQLVSMLDPATKFVGEVMTYQGTYSIGAYPGNFTVLVRNCNAPTRSAVSSVSLTSGTSLNLSLGNAKPDAFETDLNMTSWKSARRTVHSNLSDLSAQDRFLADELGNRDGLSDPVELRILRSMELPYFTYPNQPRDLIIDGRSMPYRSIVSFDVNGSGPIVSSADLTESLVADSWLMMDPIGTHHNVTLWFPYNSAAGTRRYTLHLPHGVAGNATGHGNVTVLPLGPGAWSIDPGTDPHPPAPGFFPSPAYVTIDVVTPEPPPATGFSVPLEWVLASGGGVAAVAAVAVGWWILRRRRRPPDLEPKVEVS